jgi:transketolase
MSVNANILAPMSDIKMRPTRFGFGKGLADVAAEEHRIVGLGADITSSVSMNFFRDSFPQRFFSFGIAEQNIAAAATGMALNGLIPVFSTYATFVTTRALDQIRVSICYNKLHVIIGGAHAGISVGPDGATHQALEDIAIMRTLPYMTVLSPCDATQAEIAVRQAVLKCNGPVYIRFGREPVPDFTFPDQDFSIGKGQILRLGTDITIIATGHMVWESLQAALQLEKQGVSAQVVNIHTIKPIDRELIVSCARKTGLVVTVEEHQVIGGLGSAVAEVLGQECPTRIEMIGIPDCFGESGSPEELLKKYGLDSTSIANRIANIVKK